MVLGLLQVLEFVTAVVVAQNEPQLLAVRLGEHDAALGLHNALEDVHVDLAHHVRV